MQQRATNQEAGGTGGVGPWPAQAPRAIVKKNGVSSFVKKNWCDEIIAVEIIAVSSSIQEIF